MEATLILNWVINEERENKPRRPDGSSFDERRGARGGPRLWNWALTEVTGKSSTSQEEEASWISRGYDQWVARSKVNALSSGAPDSPKLCPSLARP